MNMTHRQVSEIVSACARCGFCRARCPVYRELGWESYAPIGKLAVARMRQGSEWKPDQAERVFRCTLCGSCRIDCPLDLDLRETWTQMRAELGHAALAPEAIGRLKNAVTASHNIAGEANENRNLWADDVAMASAAFCRPDAEVVYFVGCVASLYPTVYGVPRSFSQVLAKMDVNFSLMGGEEWCCGFPMLAAGVEEGVAELAAHNVEAVRRLGASTVVTTCPSCYHVWKHVYPELVGNFDLEVVHSVELLNRLDPAARLGVSSSARRVTYHDPCDLGRLSGLYEPPRDLIRRLPGVELVEMRHHGRDALCCGGGGDLEMIDPQLSAAIARKRLDEAVRTGAEAIVTACQQCKRTLLGAARKNKIKMKVLDVGELVWESISDEGDE